MKSGRNTALAVIAVLSLPFWSLGQSTLNFPRVMQPQDFGTTGLALVNPGPIVADVTFTMYSEGGSVLATTNETIPVRGQLSKLARELFPSTNSTGWIQATSAAA